MKLYEAIAELMLQKVRDRIWRPGDKLPSVNVLSGLFGISRATTLLALHFLEGKKRICKLSGGKGFAVEYEPAISVIDSSKITPQYRYKELADILRKEIWQGHYNHVCALPSTSILAQRFGGHAATLNRARALLVKEGLVERKARDYRIVTQPSRRRASVFLAGSSTLLLAENPFQEETIRAIEEQLYMLGWGRLEYLLSDDPFGSKSPGPDRVSAFIHFTHGQDRAWNRFFANRADIPLAVIDFTEQAQSFPRRSSRYLLFQPSNRCAGKTVANHLIARGHNHIAFFNHTSQKTDWAVLRLRGVNEVFTSSGTGDKTVSVFQTEKKGHLGGLPAPSEQSDSSCLFADNRIASLFPEICIARHRQRYERLYQISSIAPEFYQYFERAFAMRSRITAWVCVNDDIALLAHHYLKSKGNQATSISLVSFDNSPETFFLGISSYDFRFKHFGYAATHSLASSRAVSGKGPLREIIEGVMVVRSEK